MAITKPWNTKVHLCGLTQSENTHDRLWFTTEWQLNTVFAVCSLLLLLLLIFLLRLLSHSLPVCVYEFRFYTVCVRFCCVFLSHVSCLTSESEISWARSSIILFECVLGCVMYINIKVRTCETYLHTQHGVIPNAPQILLTRNCMLGLVNCRFYVLRTHNLFSKTRNTDLFISNWTVFVSVILSHLHTHTERMHAHFSLLFLILTEFIQFRHIRARSSIFVNINHGTKQ